MFLRLNVPLILIIAALFLICFCINLQADSFTLHKSTADLRYDQMLRCIKNNNNNITMCRTELFNFLEAESTLMRIDSDVQIDRERLSKIVNFIEKSAQTYFERGKQTKKIEYYRFAAECSDILLSISNRFSDYIHIREWYEKIVSVNSRIEPQITLLNSISFNSDECLTRLDQVVTYINSNKEYMLDDNLEKIKLLGQDLIDNYISKLEKISNDMDSGVIPNISARNFALRSNIYETAKKIPNVESRSAKDSTLRSKISIKTSTSLDQIYIENNSLKSLFTKNKQDELVYRIESYLSNADFAYNSFRNLNNVNEFFYEFPSLSAHETENIKLYMNFWNHVLYAIKYMDRNDYINSAISWQKCSELLTADHYLAKHTDFNLKHTVEVGVEYYLKEASELAANYKFNDSLSILTDIVNRLPLNSQQNNLVNSQMKQIIADGQQFYYLRADELRKRQQYDEALAMINNSEVVGINNHLLDLRVKIYNEKYPQSKQVLSNKMYRAAPITFQTAEIIGTKLLSRALGSSDSDVQNPQLMRNALIEAFNDNRWNFTKTLIEIANNPLHAQMNGGWTGIILAGIGDLSKEEILHIYTEDEAQAIFRIKEFLDNF